MRYVLWTLFGIYLAGMVFIGVLNAMAGNWMTVATLAIILVLVVSTEMRVRQARRFAFQAGWLHGRAAMLSSMPEAAMRGMSPLEWVLAEAERDGMDMERMHRAVGIEPPEDLG